VKKGGRLTVTVIPEPVKTLRRSSRLKQGVWEGTKLLQNWDRKSAFVCIIVDKRVCGLLKPSQLEHCPCVFCKIVYACVCWVLLPGQSSKGFGLFCKILQLTKKPRFASLLWNFVRGRLIAWKAFKCAIKCAIDRVRKTSGSLYYTCRFVLYKSAWLYQCWKHMI
jgi:hypothetical protein